MMYMVALVLSAFLAVSHGQGCTVIQGCGGTNRGTCVLPTPTSITGVCVCRPGYAAVPSTASFCQDVNECLAYPCGFGPRYCVNTIGSFRCISPYNSFLQYRYLAELLD